eukprot:5568522-Alexandrium_andersonii.AAC.1
MSASLVGSEMCIRDSFGALESEATGACPIGIPCLEQEAPHSESEAPSGCLLYTSDAADDM